MEAVWLIAGRFVCEELSGFWHQNVVCNPKFVLRRARKRFKRSFSEMTSSHTPHIHVSFIDKRVHSYRIIATAHQHTPVGVHTQTRTLQRQRDLCEQSSVCTEHKHASPSCIGQIDVSHSVTRNTQRFWLVTRAVTLDCSWQIERTNEISAEIKCLHKQEHSKMRCKQTNSKQTHT